MTFLCKLHYICFFSVEQGQWTYSLQILLDYSPIISSQHGQYSGTLPRNCSRWCCLLFCFCSERRLWGAPKESPKLGEWAVKPQMWFSASKCKVMHIRSGFLPPVPHMHMYIWIWTGGETLGLQLIAQWTVRGNCEKGKFHSRKGTENEVPTSLHCYTI